jgi:CubicO group peptidase (beta-lactamase class C family)
MAAGICPGRYVRAMRLRSLLLALLVAVPSRAASSQAAPAPAAGAAAANRLPAAGRVAGFARARLARLDSVLEDAVRREEVAGVVALVLRDDAVVYERAAGWRDRERRLPMTPDAIFRIASQTKAITSVATLMLLEEGRFALTTPVARFLPTFARAQVAVRRDSGVVREPVRRPITVRDLLTHTAGISYGTEAHLADAYRARGLGPAAGLGWYTADKDEPICTTMDTLGTLPLAAHPGERWVYGYNTDVLGCLVERASGLPLDRFLRERITGPLGMPDTHFFLPAADRERLVTVYRSTPAGGTERADDGARGQGHYVDGPRRSFAGGAGLVSTARDYARFLQMLAHGGAWDGRRYLAPHTVALMTTNQVGTLHGETLGFGLGFETIERYGASGLASPGTWGWGGAYGTNYKVDPAEGLVIVVMVNQLPTTSDLVARVQAMVYAALEEHRWPAR